MKLRITSFFVAILAVVVWQEVAVAQEYYGFHRPDRVGQRPYRIDEEGFLNILSYKFPLEYEMDWTRADRGYRVALGSLDVSKLWHDQEFRFRGRFSESAAVMVYGVTGVDFDSDYVFIQPSFEWRVADGFEILFPTSVEFDKGFWNFGLGGRYRNPDAGIEYIQLSWLRAMALFGSHKIDSETTKVNDPADAIELQAMGQLGEAGTSRLRVTWYAPSSFTFEEQGTTEEFEGWYVHWIHQADLSESTPLFLEFTLDNAIEELLVEDPADKKRFAGERDYYQFRTEVHFNLGLGDPEGENTAERIRTGFDITYFMTDESLPNRPKLDNRVYRREFTLFGGYRYPFTQEFSLEGIIYAMARNARHNYPNDERLDDREADPFQAKLNLYLKWDFSRDAYIVLTPSFELDSFGWGGGGLQVYYVF